MVIVPNMNGFSYEGPRIPVNLRCAILGEAQASLYLAGAAFGDVKVCVPRA